MNVPIYLKYYCINYQSIIMQRKLLIPAVLTATVLVAGTFATLPIQEASTVHLNLLANRVLTTTVILDGFPGNVATPNRIDLLDTTGVGTVAEGHIVAVLPNTDNDSTCDDGDAPFAGLEFLIGDAEEGLDEVEFENIEVEGGPDMNFDGDGGSEALCIYHVTFDEDDAPTAGHIVDHVFENGSGQVLPDGSSINIVVRLEA
jgi:hypothetical protein